MTVYHLLPRLSRNVLTSHQVSADAMRALNESRAFTKATPYLLERSDGEFFSAFVDCSKCGFSAVARTVSPRYRKELGATFAIMIEESIPHPDFANSAVLILADKSSAAKTLGELHEHADTEKCCLRGGEWYRRVVAAISPELM